MRRILVVEDDKFISTIFKMFLAELGHELVARCETGMQAIELCRQLKPDVVLMDIHLKGEIDGIQTAERLRTEVDVPIIYISGDTSNLIIERAIVSNSYGYLVKPVNKKELGISIDLAFYKHRVDLEQKHREKGYREFISDSPVPIIIIRNKRIQYLNKLAIEDIMKTHYIEDVMGLEIDRFIGDEYKEKMLRLLEGLGGDENRFFDEYVVLKDVHGDAVHAEISGCRVRFNNDYAVQIIVRDVSTKVFQNRKAAFYRELALDAEHPVVVLDMNYQLLVCNNAAKKLFPTLHKSTLNFADAIKTVINNFEPMKWFDINVPTPDGNWHALRICGVCSSRGKICEWAITV